MELNKIKPAEGSKKARRRPSALAALSDADMKAVFAYLKSIKPIKNQVPAPIPPKGP